MKLTLAVRTLILDAAYRRLTVSAHVREVPPADIIRDVVFATDVLNYVLDNGRIFTDSALSSDELAATLLRMVSDSVALSDLTTFGEASALGDTTALDDAVDFVLSYIRTHADSVPATDAAVRLVGKEIADTFASSDLTVQSVIKGLSETVSTATEDFWAQLSKAFSDSTTLSDLVITLAQYPRTVADTVGSSDALLGFSFNRTDTADVAFTGDSTSAAFSTGLADTYSASDSLSAAITFVRAFAEALLATDNFQSQNTGELSSQEAEELFATEDMAFGVTSVLEDSVAALESIITALTTSTDFADSVSGFVDALTLNMFQRSSDSVSVSDAPTFTVSPVFGDTQYVIETYFALDADIWVSADSATSSDSAPTFAVQPAFSESVSASSSAELVASLIRAFSDSILSEDATLFTASPLFADTSSSSDELVFVGSTLLGDSTGASDALVTAVSSVLGDTLSSLSDASTLTIAPAYASSASASDTGLWSIQDYVDYTYLAQDYVGGSGTF